MILYFTYLISPTGGWSWCYILLPTQSEDSSYWRSQAGSQPCLQVLWEPSQLAPFFLRGISKDVPFSSAPPIHHVSSIKAPRWERHPCTDSEVQIFFESNSSWQQGLLALTYLTKYSPNPFSLNKMYKTHSHVKAPSLATPYANIKVSKSSMLSHVWLLVTPWTVAHQDPLPMKFSRQEY